MRKLSLIILGLILSLSSLHAQTKSAACHSTSLEDFTALARNDIFKMSHDEPLPFNYDGKGETISYKTPDGKEGKGFLIKNPKPTNNFLFVFQEWWGLNDYIKQESEKLFNDLGNVNVLAVDLYDGQVATTREEATKLMQAMDKERGIAIVKGAIEYAGAKSKIATIGWCFGGAWSLQSSILIGQQGAGCVMFYGMPEKDVNQLKKLQVETLGLFASKDQSITPAIVQEFEKNMKEAGKKITVKMYDANHAFANPSNPKFDKAASEDAYSLALAFLKRSLK